MNVRAYTVAEMDAAITRVETAKQNHPVGWACLDDLGLSPSDSYVRYAFANADAHLARLGREDRRVIFSAGWLNGLMVGAALGDGHA